MRIIHGRRAGNRDGPPCENRDLSPTDRSDTATIVSTAVVAYAATDVVHEVCGHALAAAFPRNKGPVDHIGRGGERASSRLVAAAGTTANVVAAAIAFAMISRRQPFEATRYCLWLFASVNALNVGYLVYSGVLTTATGPS